MTAGKSAAREEWRLHWLLLLAATVGLSFSTMPTQVLGLFMEPLHADFGWNRATISLGMTVLAVVSTLAMPFGGALIDRFGPRAVAILGLISSGLIVAAFGLLNGALAMWIGLWAAYALFSVTTRAVVWNPAISSAFVANRGLAIAILLSGSSIAGAFAPLITHELIQNFGWRSAYMALGLGWGGVALVLVLLFFRVGSKPPARGSEAEIAPTLMSAPGGLTGKEALRSLAIWRIALAVLLYAAVSSSFSVHLVPVFTSLGTERGVAAALAIVMGGASVVGNLVAGSIADRVNSSLLPLTAFSLPAAGFALLLVSRDSIPLFALAAAIIGCGAGAAHHLTLYLTTQYGGLRNFGKIYGSVAAMFGVASAIGPVTAGLIYDQTGSYGLFLTGAIPILLVAGFAVFGLGPYPDFKAIVPARTGPAG